MKTPLKIVIIALIVVLISAAYFSMGVKVVNAPTQVRAQNPKIVVPESYKADRNYTYMDTTRSVGGIKFTIPESMSTSTNLSDDSYISLEQSMSSSTCSAELFISNRPSSVLNDSGIIYSFASSSDAAAGNRYEESVYSLPNSSPCLAVRYFIHYTAYENYPTGSVNKFDKQALLGEFDSIRRSLTF